MRLRTEMFDTTGGKRIGACRADSEHDAACAHALMQAIGEIGTRGIQDADEITNRADEIMTGWGFGSTPEQPE